MTKTIALAVQGLLLIVLTGCGVFERDDPGRITACPRVGILLDASRSLEFGPGASRDVSNLAYDAELRDAAIDCEYEGNIVKSDIEFALDMWRGPAAPASPKDFRYFVAVTELNQRVITKEYFTIRAEFNSEAQRIYDVKKVENIRIPYKRLGRGDLYEILIGWDLSQEQLTYNRTTPAFEKPNLRRVERPTR